jgi:hypothetical protein
MARELLDRVEDYSSGLPSKQGETLLKQTSRPWLAALAAVSFATYGFAAYAQAPAPSSDTAKSGAMSSAMSKLSPEEKDTLKKCKAMSHDAMMADTKCKALVDAHPDLMPKDKMSSSKPK